MAVTYRDSSLRSKRHKGSVPEKLFLNKALNGFESRKDGSDRNGCH